MASWIGGSSFSFSVVTVEHRRLFAEAGENGIKDGIELLSYGSLTQPTCRP